MARNGSGTYSKVNTFVAGNSITAAGHNQNWDDLVTEVTNSVAADGQTPITGALKGANGSAGTPAYGFNSDTNTGMYRIGADNLGLAVGGTKIVDIASTGATITGTLGFSGDFAINTNKFTVTAASGNTAVAGTLAVTGNTTLTGTTTHTGVVFGPDGTKTAPAYGFTNDTDTGIYRIGANNLGFSCGDTKIIDVTTSGVSVTGTLTSSSNFTVSSGTVTLPSGSIATAALAAPPATTKISAATANNSATSLSITTGIDGTYRDYIFEVDNLIPATDNATFLFQVFVSSFQTTNYFCSGLDLTGVGTANLTSTSGVTVSPTATGISNTTASGGWSGRITLYNAAGTASYKAITVHGGAMRSGDSLFDHVTAAGAYKGGTGAVTQVRIIASSGNLVSGTITMYGVN